MIFYKATKMTQNLGHTTLDFRPFGISGYFSYVSFLRRMLIHGFEAFASYLETFLFNFS